MPGQAILTGMVPSTYLEPSNLLRSSENQKLKVPSASDALLPWPVITDHSTQFSNFRILQAGAKHQFLHSYTLQNSQNACETLPRVGLIALVLCQNKVSVLVSAAQQISS